MSILLIHVQGDNSVILEGLAPGRPVPQGIPTVDSSEVPGKRDYLVWNPTAARIEIDPAKKTAYEAIDRRAPMEKLLDLLESKGVIAAAERKGLGRG